MNSLEIHGNQGLFVSHKGILNTDAYGLDTAQAEWKCPMDQFNLAPSLGAAHPVWSWLYMERRRVEIDAGFCVITGEYCGITGSSKPPLYECSFAGAEERIETHPEFIAHIAGKPSAPKHGAIFIDIKTRAATTRDTNFEFKGFTASFDGAKNPFFGIEAYLSPEATLRQTWIATTHVTGFNIGRILAPPIPITLTTGGNWLVTGVSFQQRARIYQNTVEWRASGRNKWNTDIYG